MGSLKCHEFTTSDLSHMPLTCQQVVDWPSLATKENFVNVLRGPEDPLVLAGETGQENVLNTEASLNSDPSLVKIEPDGSAPHLLITRNRHRAEGVLAQIASATTEPQDPLQPRWVAFKQVAALRDLLGMTIKSAYEAEFMIFEEDETTPFNQIKMDSYGRFDTLAGMEERLLQTFQILQELGLPLETFMSELSAGQFEITFRPQDGVIGADVVQIMKTVLRANLANFDLVPTFMSWPDEAGHTNGFHLNHSLWVNDVNQFLDSGEITGPTPAALHWIAGLIHHAPALTALYCPTINCFRRLSHKRTPKKASWALGSRASYLRVKVERGNVYVENRLPSSACDPYLALAGTIAAGIDGMTRKLECPPQNDAQAADLPKTLEEAITALEEDQQLRIALGEDFVQSFAGSTKKVLGERVHKDIDDINYQRRVYFRTV